MVLVCASITFACTGQSLLKAERRRRWAGLAGSRSNVGRSGGQGGEGSDTPTIGVVYS